MERAILVSQCSILIKDIKVVDGGKWCIDKNKLDSPGKNYWQTKK